nr:MAG TPA: hypothetical protein [Caudoviricetes sp.]
MEHLIPTVYLNKPNQKNVLFASILLFSNINFNVFLSSISSSA